MNGNCLNETPGYKCNCHRGYEFDGTRYDCGTKLGFTKANISFALKDRENADELKRFIKDLL